MRPIPILLLFILFGFGCSKDSNPVSESIDPEQEKAYNQVVNLQDAQYAKLVTLFAQVDTLRALDSVAALFRADTSVASATAGPEGIAVQYKNGIRGGIDLGIDHEGPAQAYRLGPPPGIPTDRTQRISPSSKKTIFLVADYSQRHALADYLIAAYNENLPKVGFQLPEVYKDAEVTLDRLRSLSGYGIIHLYSHGWAFPHPDSEDKEIYLRTGQSMSLRAWAQYWADIYSGRMSLVKYCAEPQRFYVSPDFVTGGAANTDTALVYGGFCYSFLGSWPQSMLAWGAGAYLGYDGAVYAVKNAAWAKGLIEHLTDTMANSPWTVGDWHERGTPHPKDYWDTDRYIALEYVGRSDLALWNKATYRNLFFNMSLTVDYNARIIWRQLDTVWKGQLFGVQVEREGKMTVNTFTVDTVLTDSHGATDTVRATIELDGKNPTKVTKFTVSTWGMRGQDRLGWSVAGHDVPITVQQPGAFLAKVTGEAVNTYIDDLQGQGYDITRNVFLRIIRHYATDISVLQIALTEVPLIESKISSRRR